MTADLLVRTAAVLMIVDLAGCVPRSSRPEPVAVPSAPANPPPTPAAVIPDWQDWPITPGTWSYAREGSGSIARYAAGGNAPSLWLRCESASRTIVLGVRASGTTSSAQMLVVRTDFGSMQWPSRTAADGFVASRSAMDAGFDRIVFSRGRFAIEISGNAPIVVPTWAEPARVVEDCRGT